MNTSITYHKNLHGDLSGKLNTPHWPTVMQAWQSGKHLDAFHGLLDYINPDLRKTYGNKEQTSFSVPHGSVVVNINIQNNKVNVTCPFVDITGAMRVPLLRKVAELNFHPMQLSTIRMQDEKLNFHYQSELDTSEPYKTYYALQEICRTADQYDDDFRQKFKTKNILEPKVKHISSKEAEIAWKQVNEIISETIEFANYFDSKRWFGSSYDMLLIAIMRIDLCVQVQGFLKNEMERAIGDMNRKDLNVVDKNQYGRKFLDYVQKMGLESFASNLYEAEVFVPNKAMSSFENVKRSMEPSLKTVSKLLSEQNFIGATLEGLYYTYDLLHRNYVDKTVLSVLDSGLSNAAGKPWKEAAESLHHAMGSIVENKFTTN